MMNPPRSAVFYFDTSLAQAQLPPLTFIAADDDLLDAAQREGLITDNPSLHS